MDRSGDLLGESLWDKFLFVLITADKHCFWETKGLQEAFFNRHHEDYVYLNKK